MEKEKKELMDTFQSLDPENRAFLLTYARATYTAQESTKKHFLNDLKAFAQKSACASNGSVMEAVNA